MIRLATWIVASLLITAGIAWLISVPGTMTIELAGYRMQPRLGTAAFVIVVLIVVIIFLWSIIRRLLSAPRYLRRRAEDKRKQRGVDALSDAFIAHSAGNHAQAKQLAREARNHLPANAAARLLEARAHLALGDMGAAREHYRALISNPKTALAALSGLHDQAHAQGRPEVALTFAKKAVTIAPTTSWASAAVFDDLTRKGQWAEALAMIAEEPANTREEKAQKRRRQAVLETALAQKFEATDPLAALEHANAALRLLPDFVPAALIAARVHSNRGEARKAMSLLRRVWRVTLHPDIATLYANAVSGASAVDRFKRVRELIDSPPANRDAAIVLARAAIDAYEWPAARNALASFSTANPTQAVATLMAEIEEGQNADQGKAREWLARAVRAPRDPAWTADGVTAEEWAPVSPVTGKLDAFEWKVPVSAAPGRPAAPGQPPAATPTSLALPET
ncbi:MAG TPA: heme biosynthesis HemY N-terminal domain-containing protein [Arsenicitalea sp.]|nr:heme biosynthesis HemY N-terminal domain-containing protein [Arsenicitalea sp.]